MNMRASLVVSADASAVVTGMVQATNALDNVARGAKGLGDALGRTAAAASTARRDLIEATTGVGRSMSSAAASAEVFSRELAEQELAFKALRAAIDPVYRAEQQMAAAQAVVSRALKAGITDARGAAEANRHLQVQYDRARAAALGLETAQGVVGSGAGRMRGSIQQASFQIGDFATQVGAGTSAAQALGQQLPQLLGAFGTFGAVAGAVAAIFIPLGGALIKVAFDSQTLAERMEIVSARTDSMAEAATRAAEPIETLRLKYRDLADEIERADQTAAAFTAERARQSVTKEAGAVASDLLPVPLTDTGMFPTDSPLGLRRYNEALDALGESMGKSRDEARTLVEQIRALENTKGPEDVVRLSGALIDVFTSLPDAARDYGTQVDALTAIHREATRQIEAQNAEAARLFQTYDGAAAEQRQQTADLAAAEARRAQAAAEGKTAEVAEWDRLIGKIVEAQAETRRLAQETDLAFGRMKAAQQDYALSRSYDARSAQAYADYGASRRAGAALSGSGAVQASRELIIKFEGKATTAGWDENHQRAGYGSDTITLADGSTRPVTKGMRVTQEQMDRDLDRRIGLYLEEQRRVIGAAMDGFSDRQIAAISSIQHNYGSIPDRIRPALQSGDAQLIAQAIAGLAMDYTRSERQAGKTSEPMNYDRRMAEAAEFGQVGYLDEGFRGQFSARAERQREEERRAQEAAREGERLAAQDGRTRDAVTAELDKLAPSYARAIAAADRWREEALAGLDKTKAGYDSFAADIEAIYQQKVAAAFEDNLGRQKDWAAGLERGFAELQDSARSWADTSEDLVTGWAERGEQAFLRLVTTGKFSMSDLVDFTLEQLARLAWQQNIAPGLNSLLNWAGNALGGMLGGGAGASAVTIPTAHSGDRGVMRTYSPGNRLRSDERLAMLRDGERVLTPRMQENTGALVSALAGMAMARGQAGAVDARPMIQIVNNSAGQIDGEIRETRDDQGRRQYQLVLSDAVASALTVPGGRAGRTMRDQFGMQRQGPRR